MAPWDAPGEGDVAIAHDGVGRVRERHDAIAKRPPDDVRRRGARAQDVAEAGRPQRRAAATEVRLRTGDRDAARSRAERALHFPRWPMRRLAVEAPGPLGCSRALLVRPGATVDLQLD